MRQDQPTGIGLPLLPPFIGNLLNLFDTICAMSRVHCFVVVGPIKGIRFLRPYVFEKPTQCLFVIVFLDSVETRKVDDNNPALCQELQPG